MGSQEDNQEQNPYKNILLDRRQVLVGALGLFALSLFPKRAEAAPSMILNGEGIQIDKGTGKLEGIWQNLVHIGVVIREEKTLRTVQYMTGFMLNDRIMITAGHGWSKDYTLEVIEDPKDNFGINSLENSTGQRIKMTEVTLSRVNLNKASKVETGFVSRVFVIKGVDLSICILQDSLEGVSKVSLPQAGDVLPSLTQTAGYGAQFMNRMIYGENRYLNKDYANLLSRLKDTKNFSVLNDDLKEVGLWFSKKINNMKVSSIAPGDSGGPLVDSITGKLWGINSHGEELTQRLPIGQQITKIVEDSWLNLSNKVVISHLRILFEQLVEQNLITRNEVVDILGK